MFLLGILSFFQMVFIPGFILLSVFKIQQESKIQTLVYSFGLSLLFNYLMVYVLTMTGIYITGVVLSIVVIELLFLYQLKYSFCNNVANYQDSKSSTYPLNYFESQNSSIFTLAIIVLSLYCLVFISNLGTIFSLIDSMVSYNRWATDWANNHLPTLTWHYPQLVTANWSLSYVLMQEKVWFFAKAIMPLFTIGILLLFLDLAIRKKDTVYLIGLILYGLITYHYNHIFITDGYMDIPVSFFSFLTGYAILQSKRRNFDIQSLILVIIFACAAAVTKQAGLYILGISMVWITYILFTQKPFFLAIKVTFVVMAIVCMIVLSWYIPKHIQINNGLDSSEILTVTSAIYHGKPLLQRLTDGFFSVSHLFSLQGELGTIVFSMIVLCLLLSFFVKKARTVLLFIVVPYTILWGFFWSYDTRNLNLALPFIAYSSAFGFQYASNTITYWFWVWNKKSHQVANNVFTVIFVGGIILAVVLNFTCFTHDYLFNKQLSLHGDQKLIGSGLDGYLRNKRVAYNGFKGKIYTMYYSLQNLPDFKEYVFCVSPTILSVPILKDLEHREDVFYVLWWDMAVATETSEYIAKNIQEGKYFLLTEERFKPFLFLQIRR